LTWREVYVYSRGLWVDGEVDAPQTDWQTWFLGRGGFRSIGAHSHRIT
jgi:hypothetical protein